MDIVHTGICLGNNYLQSLSCLCWNHIQADLAICSTHIRQNYLYNTDSHTVGENLSDACTSFAQLLYDQCS